MTKPNTPSFDPERFSEGLAEAGRALAEVFARATFAMTAQAAFGYCLNGDHDDARERLGTLTGEQLGQVENAARDLLGLVAETRQNDTA